VNLPKIDSKFTKEEEGIFARKISFSEKIYTSVENLVTKTYYKIRRIPLIEEKRKLIDIGFWLLVFKGTWNTFLDGSGHWILKLLSEPINFCIKSIVSCRSGQEH
jgi:hypothetical protein